MITKRLSLLLSNIVKIFVVIFVTNFAICYGQNLIPNPSFEEFLSCPTSTDIKQAIHWENPNLKTPDYLNTCNTIYNLFKQTPKSGNGFVGIFVAGNEGREYIQVKLKESLISGKKYELRYHVILGKDNERGINNLGVYFSKDKITAINLLSYSPQSLSGDNFLTNKENWIEIIDTIIANGDENYMTVGNFFNEANTKFLNGLGGPMFIDSPPTGGRPYSYYFFDDFSLVEIECEKPKIHLGNDTTVCLGNELIVDMSNLAGTLLWNNGSNESIFQINQEGLYWLEVNQDNCTNRDSIFVTFNTCDSAMVFPNVFTPNNDGYNDYFKPIKYNPEQKMLVQIFNRWGNKIFESENEFWDGKSAVSGTYFWVVKYVDKSNVSIYKNGYVQLIR